MKDPKLLLTALFLVISAIFIPLTIYAEEIPFYSFIRFDLNYDTILSSLENNEYEIKESELNSPFGRYLILAKKAMSYYIEQIYLFFDQNKNLQFFTVEFLLGENQSRVLLDRLAHSIIEKLIERYGESDPGAMLYKKIVDERYEIIINPIYAGSRSLEISFKDMGTYSNFQQFYEVELRSKEDEEIAAITKKF